MDFKFDLIQPHRILNRRTGMEYRRGVLVSNIPIDEGDSDMHVFLKVLMSPDCPQIDDSLSGDHPELLVDSHELVSVARSEKHCRLDVIYVGPAVLPEPELPGGSALQFTLESDYQMARVQTNMTADGSHKITIWYDPDVTTADYSDSLKVNKHGATVGRLKAHRVLRATGYCTVSQWASLKASIYAVKDSINSETWGTAPRGTWYFAGPSATRIRGNPMVRITLQFIEQKEGFFPVVMWRNREGKIPHDINTEAEVRASVAGGAPVGNPAVNTIKMARGITIASVQTEEDFSAVFDFTPDDI